MRKENDCVWVDFGDREFAWNASLIEKEDNLGYPAVLLVTGCHYPNCNGGFAISGLFRIFFSLSKCFSSFLIPLCFVFDWFGILIGHSHIFPCAGERNGHPCYDGTSGNG